MKNILTNLSNRQNLYPANILSYMVFIMRLSPRAMYKAVSKQCVKYFYCIAISVDKLRTYSIYLLNEQMGFFD